MDDTPRLRMFAGPNGSGKSTLKEELKGEWLGHYLNADDIQRALTTSGHDITALPFELTQDQIDRFWAATTIVPDAERGNVPQLSDGRLFLNSPQASYGAAGVAELLRGELLRVQASFSFETVMSHESKIALLREARQKGYRTYLYYICTSDPAINVARVQARVNIGGHEVPEDKIRQRYDRSLGLLAKAIRASNRAYIFDNSSEDEDRVWIAQFTDGERATFKVDRAELPVWFLDAVGGDLRQGPDSSR